MSLFLFNFLIANAEGITPENKDKGAKQILIESNTQRSDFENSIFYAEGNVRITNPNEEFFAKSLKEDHMKKFKGMFQAKRRLFKKIN